ncbi:hypothetical protein CAC02_00050 [Streptococcus gallolyticus]|uniref:Lactococcin 972 family bacteriocin n=1 Tax=Streptococcus gallolyticus TaxID=315405 RepID=A0A368UG69_9STRE|nr:hypothetical protein [Streptococcus gallolyticus]RCW17931.1 hypothetical protein CAC02_00050 [Streptococcus gallolyticus]
MKKNIKKLMSTALITLTLAGVGGSMVSAATVYYKGSAVYWNYGWTAGLWSYSNVQSSVYEHSSTANGAFSGWQRPGGEARASKFIGTNTARCYWNCRG